MEGGPARAVVTSHAGDIWPGPCPKVVNFVTRGLECYQKTHLAQDRGTCLFLPSQTAPRGRFRTRAKANSDANMLSVRVARAVFLVAAAWFYFGPSASPYGNGHTLAQATNLAHRSARTRYADQSSHPGLTDRSTTHADPNPNPSPSPSPDPNPSPNPNPNQAGERNPEAADVCGGERLPHEG